MSLCLVVQDVREHFRNKNENSFSARMLQLPLLHGKLESPEFKHLLEMKDKALRDLQITPEQLRDDLLGDAIVFAYKQGAKEQDQGMFLVWARDKALLTQVVDRFNDLQKKSGELKDLRSLTHKTRSYHHRIKVKGDLTSDEFYFIRDNVLALSAQEQLIKAAIDRDVAEPPAQKKSPFWSAMQSQLGLGKSLSALMVNPRVFDAQLKAREESAKGDDQAFMKEFRKYWDAFDGLGIGVDVGEGFELDLAVSVRTGSLPQPGRRFFAEFGKPSALWKVIPNDALFAMSSRIDPNLMGEFFTSFCDRARMKQIDEAISNGPFRDKVDSFKKGLGPDWGFWVAAPALKKSWFPQAALAIKTQEGPDGAAAEEAAREAVIFLVTMAQIAGKDQLQAHTLKQDKTQIKYLTSAKRFPPGVQPAFASKDGYLIFASAPEVIQQFVLLKVPAGDDAESPLLRISARGWREFLGAHKSEIVEFVSKKMDLPAKDAETRIDAAAENLKPFDRLELLARSKPNQATLVIRLTTPTATK
jgi:hypothetical protein